MLKTISPPVGLRRVVLALRGHYKNIMYKKFVCGAIKKYNNIFLFFDQLLIICSCVGAGDCDCVCVQVSVISWRVPRTQG